MNHSDGKFLVNLVHQLSHTQLFFGIWIAIVGGFVYLLWAHYRKRVQRNFKPDASVKKSTLPVQTDRPPGGSNN